MIKNISETISEIMQQVCSIKHNIDISVKSQHEKDPLMLGFTFGTIYSAAHRCEKKLTELNKLLGQPKTIRKDDAL